MRILRDAKELGKTKKGICVAIGVFDGVHVGHQRVISSAVEDSRRNGALSVAITFDKHPCAVVAPDRAPLMICPLSQRLKLLDENGVDAIYLIHFDEAFSKQTGQDFVQQLVRDSQSLSSISIGEGFTFGFKRTGDVSLLRRLAVEYGYTVHEIPSVRWADEIVSSTRIREAITTGSFEDVNQMLGRRYSVLSEVIRGAQFGRKLGFPTANLKAESLVLPPPGVYGGSVKVGNQRYGAAANVGFRPTLHQEQPGLSFEVHILDFSEDLYGSEIEFEFQYRLRGEKKFGSVEELRRQIGDDIAAIRNRGL